MHSYRPPCPRSGGFGRLDRTPGRKFRASRILTAMHRQVSRRDAMKRTLAAIILVALALSPVLYVTEAGARAGGGSSSGSRGSRSYSSPSASSSPAAPSQPTSPGLQQPAPARPGWGGMMGGMLGGLLLGGLLGGLFFGHGGGGIGMLEILIIGGVPRVPISLIRPPPRARPPRYPASPGSPAPPAPPHRPRPPRCAPAPARRTPP